MLDHPMSYTLRLFGLVALIACLAGPSLNAGGVGTSDLVTKVYLDLPGIPGEVTDPGFEGQIEVISYSWTETSGPGELSLTKPIDVSSPLLLGLVISGNLLKAARVSAVQTINGAFYSSTTIDLRDVMVASVVNGGVTESVTLGFLRSKVTTKNGGIGGTDPVTSMYLDIRGIPGEVTDPGFEGQIEVLSYSWIETSGPGELSLTKPIDVSSPLLLGLVVSGNPLKAARLSVVETINGKVYSRTTIDLRDVFITSVVNGGVTESITLSFQRSKVS